MATMLYDPRRAETMADPYGALRMLRASDPVHWSPVLRGWLLTRYADVRAALFDPALSADRITPFMASLPPERRTSLSGLERMLTRWAVFADPPDHTRLRALINRAFTPRAIAALAAPIGEIVDRLIDGFLARIGPTGGEIELIADFAYPLPAMVIARILGVPDGDVWRFKDWSDDLAAFVGSAQATPDKYERAARGIADMDGYFRAIVRARQQAPARQDVIGALIAAEEAGRTLSEDELVVIAVLVLFAGHETTNVIGNGMIALLSQPDALNLLRAHPELAESAVKELLRYDTPAASVTRVARRDMEMGDKRIHTGDRLFLMLMAANGDPDVFENPDVLDLARDPNPHLAFGYGPHYCVGAPLARLEARIAFQRLDVIELASDRLEWSDNLVLRGVRRLPLRVRAVKPAR